ncbi:TPA: glycosyltransferase family 4 protein [Klebsiella aerogenes]|nr:glycosyltransferase family 4 protein [Klebsiella aerogenes]HDU4054872.1 glycosyltransferase family 4 protein [Klebsiella aerogenes]
MVVNTRNLLGHTTGVQRYTSSILDYWSESEYERIEPSDSLNCSGMKGHLWEQLNIPRKINKNNILWSPANTGPVAVKNQIITIHDTVPFDHPEWMSRKFTAWYKFMQPIIARKALHIITVSHFSKERIIENFNIAEEKVSVIYNGINLRSVDETPINDKWKFKNYVLTVGSVEPRKNTQRLISAFLEAKKELDPSLKLVIVGKRGNDNIFNNSNQEQLKNVQDSVIFTGHIDDDELAQIYRNAKGFCYPSIYEGFGLPPLEALAYGIPVLTSNTTSMKELFTNKAILVDPFSIESIKGGIINLLKLDNTVTLKGKEFAQTLTWEKASRETFQLLRSF